MAILKPFITTPQTAIGKGKVGDPPAPEEGKDGVNLKVALFFDGTMNNRANTAVRLKRNKEITDGSAKDQILDKKEKSMLSSYANYYSNVSILELLNKQRNRNIHEVSVYTEGIGTVNYEEGVPSKDKHGHDKVDKHGNKIIPTEDADISNDQQGGFAFGTGFTGIVDRVTQGIRKAKEDILVAYDKDKQFIKTITIDVIGFSRGAAAARHFVSRYKDFRGVWPQKSPPELVMNFVGLFETVSSYHGSGNKLTSLALDMTRNLFDENVGELQLALGGVPLRVIHLTAQDEIRRNFSLTTIDSSLEAGNAFQVSLPGVHSDIGGGYVERDPDNPEMDPTKTYPNDPSRPAVRLLNRENRQMYNQAEKRQLVAEGWYTDGTNGTRNQFKPVFQLEYTTYKQWEDHRAAVAKHDGRAYQRAPFTGEEYGSRYLTNEYQYVALYLMLQMAQNDLKPGAHTKMVFKPLTGENKIYKVPADLIAVRDHFKGLISSGEFADGKPDNKLDFATTEQGKKTRNKYLHRSSVLLAESGEDYLVWVAYRRAPHDTRVVYSDKGKSTAGKKVKVVDLGEEAPKGADTLAVSGAPAAGQVPTENSVTELNDPLEVPEAPPAAPLPQETGNSELYDTP